MRNVETTLSSAANALQIVELISREQCVRVTEVSAHLGVARSTAHRLLSTLMDRGFVVQDARKVYWAGPTLERLRDPVPQRRRLSDVFLPHLRALAASTGETCHVGVLEGNGVRFTLGVKGVIVPQAGMRIGMLLPAHSTAVGRALLAELPPSELRALYPRGVTGEVRDARATLFELERQVRTVRKLGYARNERESDSRITALAIPLRDGHGRSIAAMALAMPASRFERSALPHLLQKMRSTASDMRSELTSDPISSSVRLSAPAVLRDGDGFDQVSGLAGFTPQLAENGS